MIDSGFDEFARVNQGEKIVEELQKQQHLHPHRTVKEALARARAGAGFCAATSERATATLHLDPQRKIGRLKRSELIQLARVIHRLWRQQLEVAGHSVTA